MKGAFARALPLASGPNSPTPVPSASICGQSIGLAFLLLGTGLTAAQPPSAAATTNAPSPQPYTLEPVMVWGQPQTELPGSTTVPSDDALALRAFSSVLDLNAATPGLGVFQAGGERIPRFTLRGLRENNLAGEPEVTLYVDDVPYDDLFARGLPLFDVASVELRRGPQGTLFGASRPGGLLNIQTRLPDNQWRAQAALSYGNYNAVRADAALAGPLITNSLYAGLAGLFSRRDGFVYNQATGHYSDSRETVAGRGSLRWTPVAPLDITFSASGYQFRDGMLPALPLGQLDSDTVSRNVDGFANQNAHTESLRAAFHGVGFKVVSVTSHTDLYDALLQDADLRPVDIAVVSLSRGLKEWTQELRVQSLGPDALCSWVAGGYFSDRSRHTELENRFSQLMLTNSTFQRSSFQDYALFGQSTVAPWEKLELTAGLRFEYNARSSTGVNSNALAGAPGPPVFSSAQAADDFHALQPKFEAAWQFTPTARVWVGVARAYQPGGFNFFNGSAPPEFLASDSWHYEVGARCQTPEGKLEGTAVLFYSEVHNFQDFRPTGFGTFVMLNADRVHTAGFEVELLARPARPWELTCRAGYISARFDRFTDPLTGANFDGKDIDFVPEYTLDLAAVWRPGHGLFLQAGAQGIGYFPLNEANTARQAAYWLLSLRAGWETRHGGFAVFGRNLLGTHYVANAIQLVTPQGSMILATPGEPLMFGIEAFASFLQHCRQAQNAPAVVLSALP